MDMKWRTNINNASCGVQYEVLSKAEQIITDSCALLAGTLLQEVSLWFCCCLSCPHTVQSKQIFTADSNQIFFVLSS